MVKKAPICNSSSVMGGVRYKYINIYINTLYIYILYKSYRQIWFIYVISNANNNK